MKVPYRLDGDFEPLIKVSVSYNVLVVNPTVEAHSVPELVALIEAQAGHHDVFVRRIRHAVVSASA